MPSQWDGSEVYLFQDTYIHIWVTCWHYNKLELQLFKPSGVLLPSCELNQPVSPSGLKSQVPWASRIQWTSWACFQLHEFSEYSVYIPSLNENDTAVIINHNMSVPWNWLRAFFFAAQEFEPMIDHCRDHEALEVYIEKTI